MLKRTAGPLLAALVPLGLLLAAFVYGYPRVFPLIERDHVDNYLERVTELTLAGRPAQATKFLAHAAAQRPHDPDAWYLLATMRHVQQDRDGALEAARHAVAIRQTMDGVPTRRPHFDSASRIYLMQRAMEAGDRAAALGHYELARRFIEWPPEAVAPHTDQLDQPVRSAALRGELDTLGGEPAEWFELTGIRQHRPWEPCQLRTARLGLYDDGRVDFRLAWTMLGEALPEEALPILMNEVPMDLLAELPADTRLGDDAPEALSLAIPGWETTPHLWHAGSSVQIEQGDTPALVITREGEPGNALINTLPVRAEGGMLVAVRIRAEGAPASIAWLAEDALENESFRDTFEPVPPGEHGSPGEWTWRAAYHPASLHWDASWLQIGIYNGVGRVWIDQVVMLPIPEIPTPCGEIPGNSLAESP